jgi:hypothetical protein
MDCEHKKLLSEIYNRKDLTDKGRKLATERVKAMALLDHLDGKKVSPKALPKLP